MGWGGELVLRPRNSCVLSYEMHEEQKNNALYQVKVCIKPYTTQLW